MSIAERISKALKTLDGQKSAQEVADACGVTVQAVYKWIRGDVKTIEPENLFKIADLTGFDARWIGTGKGPEKTPADPTTSALLAFYSSCDARGKSHVLKVAESEAHYIIDQQPK